MISLLEAFSQIVSFIADSFKVPLVHFTLEFILLLILAIIWRTKKIQPHVDKLKLSKEEEDALICEWVPKPLVPIYSEDCEEPQLEITGKLGASINVNGKMCFNLATTNFLNFVGKEEFEANADKCIRKYGVGTCGPRGFYGTTDVHLRLEKALAEFCRKEDSILYSYGFSTISSVIPAYSKKNDIIFADQGLCLPIKLGIFLSHSSVYWYSHNNMDCLQKHLETVKRLENENPKKFQKVRKFIIVEGIYMNYGDSPPMERIVEFKRDYKVRIILEESLSMGVIGKSGRGITELQNIDVNDIDIISFSLENVFASVGGVCAASKEIIDHQRLSGLGYVFSASNPTFLCQTVLDSLEYMKNNPSVFSSLKKNIDSMAKIFKKELDSFSEVFVCNDSHSPITYIRLKDFETIEESKQLRYFKSIMNRCLEEGVAVSVPYYLKEKELFCPPPCLQVCINTGLKMEDIQRSARIITSTISGLSI